MVWRQKSLKKILEGVLLKLVVDKTFKAHYVIIHLEMKVDMFFKSSISSPYLSL